MDYRPTSRLHRVRRACHRWHMAVLASLAVCTAPAAATEPLNLSLEELLNAEVTTASRKPQALQTTPAAVFVISREDIARSGALHITDALQMAPGVQVARIANNHWAISVRGFNGRFANKLLVLIDGRSIYSPLFSGVLWELEDPPLEDVERIEVIRGPGAAMWGANAVNGVINIITRKARDTQGTLLAGGAGQPERAFGVARLGTELGHGHVRVWAKVDARDGSLGADGSRGNDDLRSRHAGVRADWALGGGNRLMMSGGIYNSPGGDTWDFPSLTSPTGYTRRDITQVGKGGHLLARHDWILPSGSEASLQGYVTRTDLRLGDLVHEQRNTIDIDFQQRLRVGASHDLLWGLGYRRTRDEIDAHGMFRFTQREDDIELLSAFVHDEYTLLPDTLSVLAGARFEHTTYTGFSTQPSLRLMWTPSRDQAFWAAASRAERTPSRAELHGQVDLRVIPAVPPMQPATLVRNVPTGRLETEKLTAYELGYRYQVGSRLSLDLTGFANRYRGLRGGETGSVEFATTPFFHVVQNMHPNNSLNARSRGVELALDWHAAGGWRVQPSYTFLRLTADADASDPVQRAGAVQLEGASPRHQLSLRSLLALPYRQQFDLWLRHVSALRTEGDPARSIDAYTTLDLRWAWRPSAGLELSLAGQNLLESAHAEMLTDYVPAGQRLVERSWYVKARWQF